MLYKNRIIINEIWFHQCKIDPCRCVWSDQITRKKIWNKESCWNNLLIRDIYWTIKWRFLVRSKNKIEEITWNFNFKEAKPTNTPIKCNYLNIDGEEQLLPDNTDFQKGVDKLLFMAAISRSDIFAAVNILSSINTNV